MITRQTAADYHKDTEEDDGSTENKARHEKAVDGADTTLMQEFFEVIYS